MKVERASFCNFEPLNGFGNPFFHVGIGLGMTPVAEYTLRSDSRLGFLSGKGNPFRGNVRIDDLRRIFLLLSEDFFDVQNFHFGIHLISM